MVGLEALIFIVIITVLLYMFIEITDTMFGIAVIGTMAGAVLIIDYPITGLTLVVVFVMIMVEKYSNKVFELSKYRKED